MTLTDKIKQVFHKDKDGSTTGQATLGSEGGSHSAEQAVGSQEPLTGPEAYQPLSKSQHTSSQPSHTTGASDGYQGGSAGQVSDSTASGGSAGHFKQGYKEGEPGYSSEYKTGEPLYKESVQERKGGDGSYEAELSVKADNEHWRQARELTLAAEREVASAEIAGTKANKELLAAEKAEQAVRKAQLKHREALDEAEKYRGIMGEANLKDRDLADAQEAYNARLRAAEEAERGVKDAESDLVAKQRELESLHPHIQKHGQKLPGLEEELARRQRERADAESTREQLLLASKDTESNYRDHASRIEALERELEQQERTANIKQQEYVDARNAAEGTARKLHELKSKLSSLDQELLGARNRVGEVEENLPGYKEAELRAQRDLDNSRSEWHRLKELEEEYTRQYNSANSYYQSAQSNYDPASRELQDSQSTLRARQEDLERARSRAAQGERKYKELLGLANRHKKYGDSAVEAAEAHGEKFEALKQEAHIHGDKHVEYWKAAEQEGNTGSGIATDAVHKLEQKVRNLMRKNEA